MEMCGVFVTNRIHSKIGFIDRFDVHLVRVGRLNAVDLKEMSNTRRENVRLERLISQDEDLLM